MMRAVGIMKKVSDRNLAIPEPDYKQLEESSNFSKSELRVLFSRFCILANPKGKVDPKKFATQQEVVHCSVTSFLTSHVLSRKGTTQLDFDDFVKILSKLSIKASLNEKCGIIYDMVADDETGQFSKARFKSLLVALSRGVMHDTSSSVVGIIDKLPETISRGDMKGLIHHHDIMQYFSAGFF